MSDVRPYEVGTRDRFTGEGAERFEAAAARFVGSEILSPLGAAFEESYGALAAYFEPKNEIEQRPILERWLSQPIEEGRFRIGYHLLAWHDGPGGALAAVRDCFVGVDVDRRRCVVLLSHSYVTEPYRRSGVAALVRTAPADLARRELARLGLDPETTPILLVAEMEPVVPSDRASIVRLLSYGRTGFGAIPPSVLPYCQPDFRVLASGDEAMPIPMPCVVRWLGHEVEGAIPVGLAEALIEQLALLHLRACEPTHLVALATSDLKGLATYSSKAIGLIRLPRTTRELMKLEPLLRSRALIHYPERFRVDVPDRTRDLEDLREAARAMETP